MPFNNADTARAKVHTLAEELKEQLFAAQQTLSDAQETLKSQYEEVLKQTSLEETLSEKLWKLRESYNRLYYQNNVEKKISETLRNQLAELHNELETLQDIQDQLTEAQRLNHEYKAHVKGMSGSLARIRIEKAEISCELKLAHKEIQSLKAKEHLSQLKTKKEAANVAFNAGRLQEAYDLYTAALKIDPENKDIGSRLYSNRALVLVKLTKYREAVSDCNKALRLDPGFAKVYARRAQCYLHLGNLQEAVRDLERATEKDPGNREHQYRLEEVQQALDMMLETDHYIILGLAPNCMEEDIRRTYLRLALQYHPDKNAGDPVAEARFKRIGVAYEVLSNLRRR